LVGGESLLSIVRAAIPRTTTAENAAKPRPDRDQISRIAPNASRRVAADVWVSSSFSEKTKWRAVAFEIVQRGKISADRVMSTESVSVRFVVWRELVHVSDLVDAIGTIPTHRDDQIVTDSSDVGRQQSHFSDSPAFSGPIGTISRITRFAIETRRPTG
jgi:hypothetical protein